MSVYNLCMGLGVVVLIGIVLKGFWGCTKIKPVELLDNPQSDGIPPN